MKIGPFGLWMLATILVGGVYVFTQIPHVSNVLLFQNVKAAAPIVDKQTDKVSPVQNKWSVGELEKIEQNPPFKLILPNDSILTKSELTGAYVSKVKDGVSNHKQVDLFYKTPEGDVSIWETNMKENEDDVLNSYEITYIGKQEWNYDKDLKMFYSLINGLQIHISGEVPKERLLTIIKSLNIKNTF